MKINKFLIGLSALALVACSNSKNKKNGLDSDMSSQEEGYSDEMGFRFNYLSKSEDVKDRVFFKYDSYKICPKCKKTTAIIEKQAQYILKEMKAGNISKVVIEGHCDARGTAEYNMALGEKRANSLKHSLVKLGVPADKIQIVSYGLEKPEVMGDSEDSYKQNRRAVVVPTNSKE